MSHSFKKGEKHTQHKNSLANENRVQHDPEAREPTSEKVPLKPEWWRVRKWSIGTWGFVLSLLSFVVFGGKEIWEIWNRKPDLVFRIESMEHGSLPYPDLNKTYTTVTVNLSILNNGGRPYFPEKWEMEILMKDGEKIASVPAMPPSGIHFYDTHDSLKNIQFVTTIQPLSRVDGFLTFIIPTNENPHVIANEKAGTYLICQDMLERRYKYFQPNQGPYQPRGKATVHPRTGTTIVTQ